MGDAALRPASDDADDLPTVTGDDGEGFLVPRARTERLGSVRIPLAFGERVSLGVEPQAHRQLELDAAPAHHGGSGEGGIGERGAHPAPALLEDGDALARHDGAV